jgi:hypothetical protein
MLLLSLLRRALSLSGKSLWLQREIFAKGQSVLPSLDQYSFVTSVKSRELHGAPEIPRQGRAAHFVKGALRYRSLHFEEADRLGIELK